MLKNFLLLLCLSTIVYLLIPSKSLDIHKELQVKLSELISNPLDFENKLVKVSGKALVSFCMLTGYYLISDEEKDLILVKPKNQLPEDGTIFKITGKVHKLLTINNNHLIVIEEL